MNRRDQLIKSGTCIACARKPAGKGSLYCPACGAKLTRIDAEQGRWTYADIGRARKPGKRESE